MAKSKVTLYHSELVKDCTSGPVTLTVKSDVLQSKYPGKPPYVEVDYNGEKRQYWCDNDEVAAFFEGQKGRSFSVMAEGGKGQELLSYVGEAAASATAARARGTRNPPAANAKNPPARGKQNERRANRPPPAREQQEQRQEPQREEPQREQPARGQTTNNTPEQIHAQFNKSIRMAKQFFGRQANCAVLAAIGADHAASEYTRLTGKKMSDERVQGIAMRFMMAADSAKIPGTLPANLLDTFEEFIRKTEKKKEPEAADQDGSQT